MDRSTALKNLGLGVGYAIATPTIMNILASCSDKTIDWDPIFFSEEEKYAVTKLSNLIIPEDELPGALNLNIPQFIDKMYHEIETEENKLSFKEGFKNFSQVFTKSFNEEILKGKDEDFDAMLIKYLNISDEDFKLISEDKKKLVDEIPEEYLQNYHVYKFVLPVRSYTIFGYCTSEKVGEEIMAYDPIPGTLNSCISLEEATKGRVWSL